MTRWKRTKHNPHCFHVLFPADGERMLFILVALRVYEVFPANKYSKKSHRQLLNILFICK